MNSEIQERTNKKIKENQEIGEHQWIFHGNGYDRSYIVLPSVFSPAIFLGTQWLTHQIIKRINTDQSFLQIGCGIGVTSIQLYLQKQNKKIICTDINPNAIASTKLNMQNHKAMITTQLSNIYSTLTNKKFDVIYWNFPFHETKKVPQSLSMLEKAIRDSNYDMLTKFISSSWQHLQEKGRMYLGFSEVMGNIQKLSQICNKYGYRIQVCERMEYMGKNMICLVELSKI